MGTMCLMLASYLLGWIIAHNVVASECRKLGNVLNKIASIASIYSLKRIESVFSGL